MATKFASEMNVKFLLYDVFDVCSLLEKPYYSHHNKKMFDMVLKAALKLSKDKLFPLLEDMDREEPELVAGEVKVHPSVPALMEEYGNGGWIGASFSESVGGEQLPLMITSCIKYFFTSANYSASVYPELTAGAAHLITAFGNEDLIKTYVPKMIDGKWQGTMALTEPDAGSSLADIATMAFDNEDGTYRIQGQKVFISAGDHNGVENVIHLMLGRIEGAPEGVKGISLFVVPKKRIQADGTLINNDITVSQVFHKLGYKGAPITELVVGEQGETIGYLIGEPHKGLFYMFQMMNESRLGVGMGATGIASAAYYASLEYAKERLQGRKSGQKKIDQSQVPIIEHADVKRMLLFQRSIVEGSLALLIQCAKYADFATLTEGEEKEKNDLLLDILTPIAKSYPSEMSVLSTSQAVQCLGGYGYCKDFPVEQYYRDTRIHPIHEGTTGIQGMDLLGRKVIMKEGKAFQLYLEVVKETILSAGEAPTLQGQAKQLANALQQLEEVTAFKIIQRAERGVEVFLADATLYLEYFGLITIGWQWLKQAVVALKMIPEAKKNQRDFLAGKQVTFNYFFAYELPKIQGLAIRLMDNEAVTVEAGLSDFSD